MAQHTRKSETSWYTEKDDTGIVWLHFDNIGGSTNVLSAKVLEELWQNLDDLAGMDPRGLVILSDKNNGFIAGADVNEFADLETVNRARELIRRGQKILERIAQLPFPSVALIHGFCLGGGLELALACRYRVAEDEATTRLGLPEIRLGIHPGFGGTVRSIQVIGPVAALDLMLSGRTLSARAAKKIGLVDHIVAKRHLRDAARTLILTAPPARRAGLRKSLPSNILIRPLFSRYLKHRVSRKANPQHYPAPYALIDLWCRHVGEPHRMMSAEADSVARLVISPTAKNLVRVFQLQNQLKSTGRSSDFSPRHVHVIGSGVMGGDIAAWCAYKGFRVSIYDPRAASVGAAMKRAHNLFHKKLKIGRLTQAADDRLIPDLSNQDASGADVIIEAIYENAEAKQNLYREIEPRLKDGALLATNTSSIPLQTLSTVLTATDRLVGLHFFNPVEKMPLVEIVRTEHTNQQALDQASAFARQIDRLPLLVKSTPGFLVNRILMPYLLEAVILESEGVPAVAIDKAAMDFGMPMGPITLADTVGLDICLSVAEILAQSMPFDIPERLRQLVGAGHVGRKSGQGFYRYQKGRPVKASISNKDSLPRDLGDRLILRMLNEAVACLDEQVVDSADHLDAGVIFGTGFAPFRGGPIHYISCTGAAQLLETLHSLEQRHGERFKAHDGWTQLVQTSA